MPPSVKIPISSRLNRLPKNDFRELTALKYDIKSRGREILDLSEGLPDVAPHPRLLSYLSCQVSNEATHCYPTRSGSTLLNQEIRTFMQQQFGVDNSDYTIMPVAGSKEVFAHLAQALLNPGDIALLPKPGYPIYTLAIKYAGAEVAFYEYDHQGNIQLNNIDKKILDRVRIMFLNSPSNPTGIILDHEVISTIIDFCSLHNIIICHDMAYSHITNSGKPAPSLLQAADRWSNIQVLEVHSFSKNLSVPGWRFGFVIGHPNIVELLERSKAVFDTGIFPAIQLAARYALIHFDEFSESAINTYIKRRRYAENIFKKYLPSISVERGGFFLWINFGKTYAGTKFTKQLLQDYGILILPGSFFGDTDSSHIRISLTANENILYPALVSIKELADQLDIGL